MAKHFDPTNPGHVRATRSGGRVQDTTGKGNKLYISPFDPEFSRGTAIVHVKYGKFERSEMINYQSYERLDFAVRKFINKIKTMYDKRRAKLAKEIEALEQSEYLPEYMIEDKKTELESMEEKPLFAYKHERYLIYKNEDKFKMEDMSQNAIQGEVNEVVIETFSNREEIEYRNDKARKVKCRTFDDEDQAITPKWVIV